MVDVTLLFWLLLSPIIIFLVLLTMVCARLEYKLSDYRKIPGLPILQNYFVLTNLKDLLQKLTELKIKYGNIFKINVCVGFPVLIITDLKVLEYILGTTRILNKSFAYRFLDSWLGSGLLTSVPDKWRKTRKMLTPAFHFEVLDQYLDSFQSSSAILVEKLKTCIGKGPVDIYPYVTLCTLDVICESAMGTKVHAQENSESEYVKGVRELCRIIVERSVNPIKLFHYLYMLTRDYRIERHYLKIIHNYTKSVIRSRREELKKSGIQGSNKRKRLAFLDLLLQSTIDGRPMTDEEIREEVDTFMFAGHDTTASAISFILYSLSKYPNVQQNVMNELEEILGNEKHVHPTIKQLNEMKYLERVIKEVLRLYPPVPIFGRMPMQDTPYFDGLFPVLSQLMIASYCVHRDPNIYPDPEAFDPDRFLPENQKGAHPYSFLAFSAGPRNCIGQRFAMLEMKYCICRVLKHFVLKPVEGYEPKLIPLAVLKSLNGIQVKLEERI